MKIAFDSPVILIFSFVCAAIYLLTSNGILADSFVLMPKWEFSSASWYFRLFSHALGHVNATHLMGNLALILLIGPVVEKRYGIKNLLIMMFSVALVTSLVHLIISDTMLLGASGIVFMMILLTPLVNFKGGKIPLTFILVVIIYIGGEVMASFEDDQVAHSAHIVGGLVGAGFGFALARKGKSENPMDALKS